MPMIILIAVVAAVLAPLLSGYLALALALLPLGVA